MSQKFYNLIFPRMKKSFLSEIKIIFAGLASVLI